MPSQSNQIIDLEAGSIEYQQPRNQVHALISNQPLDHWKEKLSELAMVSFPFLASGVAYSTGYMTDKVPLGLLSGSIVCATALTIGNYALIHHLRKKIEQSYSFVSQQERVNARLNQIIYRERENNIVLNNYFQEHDDILLVDRVIPNPTVPNNPVMAVVVSNNLALPDSAVTSAQLAYPLRNDLSVNNNPR